MVFIPTEHLLVEDHRILVEHRRNMLKDLNENRTIDQNVITVYNPWRSTRSVTLPTG